MRRSLTDLTLRKMVPPRGRIEVWDTRLPGFGVRMSDSGAKTFVVMYRARGVKRRMTLGRWPIVSLGEAREMAVAALNNVARGIDPQVHAEALKGERAEEERYRFPAVVRTFVELHCEQRNKAVTKRDTERILTNRFVGPWAKRDIREIKKVDVLKILDRIVAEGTPSAANHALAAIRKLFNWCVERGLLEHNPCAGMKKPARDTSRERLLADDELRAVWRGATSIGYPFGTIVQLLILTGQRRCEVSTMSWPCMDFEQKLWSLPQELTKNNRPHDVPLSPSALAILETVPRLNSDLIFPAGGKQSSFANFSEGKKRVDELSGVSNWTLHDLRRTAATGMARLGVAPHVIERVLNHTTGTLGGVAGVYNRFRYLPEMRAALDLWAEHIDRLVEPGRS